MSQIMHTNILGAWIGPEDLINEYKEFCLIYFEKFYNLDELSCLTNSPKLFKINTDKFNHMIRYGLKYYFDYLPKYIGNYSVMKDTTIGKLHFGVTDGGIISGIPYFGSNLPIDIIQKLYNKVFSKLRVSNVDEEKEQNILNWYKDNIKIEITKLEIDGSLLDNEHIKRLEKLKLIYNRLVKQWDEYNEKYKLFYCKLQKYNRKLILLINDYDIRLELIDYIINVSKEREYHDFEFQRSIIKLQSDDYIDCNITIDTIDDIAFDYNNPITWLILFKDYKLNEIRKTKPRAPAERVNDFNYSLYLQNVSNIRNFLISQKCNFFKITFLIPCNSEYVIEYSDKYGKWHKKMRLINKSGPYTNFM